MDSQQEAKARLQAMHDSRAVAIADWLEEGEQVLNTGTAVWVARAEERGRGAGEGILYLTTSRLIWRDDRDGDGLSVPREDISSVRSKRILLPGMRQLAVTTGTGGNRAVMEFYLARLFAKELEEALG